LLSLTKHFQLSRLGVGILLATVGALSVHAVMLQELHVPFPELSAIPPAFKFAIRVMATLGLMFFWQLSSPNRPRSFAQQSVALFFKC
jgi:hypothetical protein